MKLNLNTDEMFSVLNTPDDETILHLAEHYTAADQDTMERIFRKSQQKYKAQTVASNSREGAPLQSDAGEKVPGLPAVSSAAAPGTANADPEPPASDSTPIRRFTSGKLLSVLTAAACMVIVCLDFYGAFRMLTIRPKEQSTEQTDTTSSSGETAETSASAQTKRTVQDSGTRPQTETGLIFEAEPHTTSSAVYTVTTAAESSASTYTTTVPETVSALPTGTVHTTSVPEQAAQTILTVPGTAVTYADTSAFGATTTVTTETAVTAVSGENTATQPSAPIAEEQYEIPGFTIEMIRNTENDSTMERCRTITAVPDENAPEYIEKHYEIRYFPLEMGTVKERSGADIPLSSNQREYEKSYAFHDDSGYEAPRLSLTQSTQADFIDSFSLHDEEYYEMMPYTGITPDVHPVRINGNPGFYYGIVCYQEGRYTTNYILYWKQDGYVMMLTCNEALSLEELWKIAESVAPENGSQ